MRRYRRKNARADIECAIRLFRRARDAAPAGTFRRAVLSRGLGEALDLLAGRTGDAGLLAEAVQAVRDAVGSVPAGDPSRPMFEHALADLLCNRFVADKDALREAADLARQLIEQGPRGDAGLGEMHELLGTALHALFLLTSDPQILTEALGAAREAIAAGTWDRDPVTVAAAAGQLHALFQATGDKDALRDAVAAGRGAAAMAYRLGDRIICLNNLGNALNDLAQVEDDLTLYNEAVRIAREALAITRPDAPARPTILCNLGIGLRSLAENTGDHETLSAAAEAGRAAVAASRAGDPMLCVRQAMLQVTLIDLFKATGDLAAMREAAQAGREVVALTPASHPDQAMVLMNQAASLRDMAVWGGNQALLAEAVEAARLAVTAAPRGHAMRGMTLVCLGQALAAASKREADLTVAAEAARVLRDAVAIIRPGHHERSDALSPLGTALLDLWRLTGDRGILSDSVEAGRMAVAAATASAEGHKRAVYLSNLGISLFELYRVSPSEALGEEMVSALRAALSVCPLGDPMRAAYLSNLSMALFFVSLDPASPSAASEAVEKGREAIAAMPLGYPGRTSHVAALGRTLMNLAEQTLDLGMAREAVRVSREAATAARDQDDQAGTAIATLGANLYTLFQHTEDMTALTEAKDVLTEAAGSANLTTRERLLVLRALMDAEMTAGDSRTALAACERAVALLPRLAARALSRVDREHALGSIFQFPAEVAAAATAAGDPERAVELLEQTRGLLIGEAIDADGSLADLRSLAPDRAVQFTRLRDRLDAADGAVQQPYDQAIAEERARLAREWDDLLAAIRLVPGLGDFMRPRSIARLSEQAQQGPVIFLYATAHRSDALILRADAGQRVRVVPLAGVTRQDITAYNSKLAAGLAGIAGCSLTEKRRGEQAIRDVLAWLWDQITGPVLAALDIHEPAGDATWPRVWWCPVGDLAFLPLHAAGRHAAEAGDADRAGTQAGVLDRVISSYTPTIRALEHARQRSASHRGGSPAALIVAMPETPAADRLPGATTEAADVARLVRDSLVLAGPEATSDTVRSAIAEYQVAHFACHGLSDPLDPGSSRLLLYDHAAKPLTVAALSTLRLRNAGLAFLSACSTARSNERLADEVVHITAAFQLAGYSRVIGTLWLIRDSVAAAMCGEVYSLLTSGGTGPVRLDESAHAVHTATRRLRERFPRSPSAWAAFVHFGA